MLNGKEERSLLSVLKIADPSVREVTRQQRQALPAARLQVDGKVRTDMFYPAGFMDVVNIEKTKENFRLLYNTKGRRGGLRAPWAQRLCHGREFDGFPWFQVQRLSWTPLAHSNGVLPASNSSCIPPEGKQGYGQDPKHHLACSNIYRGLSSQLVRDYFYPSTSYFLVVPTR